MLAFDGEDFFPEEFLAKHVEYTREEEGHNKDKKKLRQRDDSPNRRSQALEQMTEQLGGNLNDDDEHAIPDDM